MEADPAPPAPGGRPSTYTAQQGETICDRILEGESLRTICGAEGMPSRGMVLRWIAAEPEFRMLYRQARLMAAELLADDVVDIADDSGGDYVTRERPDGSTYLAFDGENVQRSRLRIETRFKILGKMLPRAYGARTETPLLPGQAAPGEPAGANGEPITLVRTLTPEQRRAVAMALAARFALEQETASSV
jgi:hypothetical protein